MTGPLQLGWPNRLTIARILLIGPFLVCLLNMQKPGFEWIRWAAVGVFALMAASDMLDGFLARRLREVSDLGGFLDPLADKLMVTTTVLALCTLGIHDAGDPGRSLLLPNWVAVAAIAKDLIVSIGFLVIYVMTGRRYIEARFLGKACTAVQLALVLAMLLWLNLPAPLARLPEILWTVATILAVAASLDYIRVGTRRLAEFNADGRRNQEGK